MSNTSRMSAATERAIARLSSGRPIREIARQEGIAPSTLYRAMERMGLAVEANQPRHVIVGAGALGRELCGWLRNDGAAATIVFVDDGGPELQVGVSEFYAQSPVVAKIDDYRPGLNDLVLLAVADPKGRATVAKRLEDRAAFFTWAHSTSIVGNAVICAGSILLPRCVVSADARLGRCCIVNIGSSIGHDVTLGDYCTVSSQVDICGRVTIGERVLIGSGARILPGVSIGDGAVIGAGAVVVRDVRDGASVFGVPAKAVA
jgi:sugar O-acyltransferase (sialic acid O-acetyltransferase NeuD family)